MEEALDGIFKSRERLMDSRQAIMDQRETDLSQAIQAHIDTHEVITRAHDARQASLDNREAHIEAREKKLELERNRLIEWSRQLKHRASRIRTAETAQKELDDKFAASAARQAEKIAARGRAKTLGHTMRGKITNLVIHIPELKGDTESVNTFLWALCYPKRLACVSQAGNITAVGLYVPHSPDVIIAWVKRAELIEHGFSLSDHRTSCSMYIKFEPIDPDLLTNLLSK